MLTLRDYQQQAVDHILRRLQDGCTRMYSTLPVGAGKSIIVAALAEQMLPTGCILVIIHRQDIAVQLARTLEQAGLQVGLLIQGYRNVEAQVVVATIQSLTTPTIQAFFHAHDQRLAAICIDEAHIKSHTFATLAFTNAAQSGSPYSKDMLAPSAKELMGARSGSHITATRSREPP